MTKWVLGFYSKHKDPSKILKQLRLKKLGRSALIHKASDGKITFRNNHNTLGLATVLCGGALFLIGILTGLSLLQLVILVFSGLLIFNLSDHWLNSGVDKNLLIQYGRWVLEEETLAIVETSDGDTRYAVEVLSGIGEEPPAIFILRPSSANVRKLRVEQPPREPLLAERLKHRAERLAAGHRVSGAVGQPQPLLQLLAESEQILIQVRQELEEAVLLKQIITPAAEWLLDNGYIIQGHIAEIRRHLPKRYYEDLPILAGDSQEINLRIYNLAREFITHTDGRVY
ncbi:MAG: hypothetical protein DMG05_12570 [Acidobacteria bacterium]|nr:MAG: hypothetical protein DMG05_12570 [Acidobacteriota bacterium]